MKLFPLVDGPNVKAGGGPVGNKADPPGFWNAEPLIKGEGAVCTSEVEKKEGGWMTEGGGPDMFMLEVLRFKLEPPRFGNTGCWGGGVGRGFVCWSGLGGSWEERGRE